ncbi:MAG: hypothetical protein ACOVP2_01765 [Armatimonadaceae bacterium]
MSVVTVALLTGAAVAMPHPPGNAKLGPSKADPLIKAALAAKANGDTKAFDAAILEAKRILATEGRYACCIDGGCTECAIEKSCGCGQSLFEKQGVCKECLAGIKAGKSRYDGVSPEMVFEQKMSQMSGVTGPWTMAREGSGTGWLPDSSLVYGRMFQPVRGWETMAMGQLVAAGMSSSGPRGSEQLAGMSQLMWMARRSGPSGSTQGLRLMVSADAWMNGGRGYQNLFQTGETSGGVALVDRQHPHDGLMELAFTGSVPLGRESRAMLYIAPVGEPALGPAAFQHRPSGWENPVAPLSHHWLDGTHITSGVLTLGATHKDKLRLEGSAFTGREPDENRMRIDPINIDSYSTRVSWNPNPATSAQVSYGFLKSPEALDPDQNATRFTASIARNWELKAGGSLSGMLAFGRNSGHGGERFSDALLAEAAYVRGKDSIFTRIERVEKDALPGATPGLHGLTKLTIGGFRVVRTGPDAEHSVGASLDLHSIPQGVRGSYGRSPVGINVMYRVRLPRM